MMPRPISSMVSVAMKDGTFRMVTSTPLMRPMRVPSTRQKMVRRDRSPIVELRREQDGEGDADQAVGRADRQIEVLVDDDEGHADRHHRIARSVAQDGVEGIAAEEEGRVDERAAGEQDRHQDEQAELPAADQLGGHAAHSHLHAVRHRPSTLPCR